MEATGDSIGNKIADKIMSLENFTKKILETNEEKILREIFIPSELRQKIVSDPILKEENY